MVKRICEDRGYEKEYADEKMTITEFLWKLEFAKGIGGGTMYRVINAILPKAKDDDEDDEEEIVAEPETDELLTGEEDE